MPYCEALADRVRIVLGPRPDIAEQKMFGGLAFLLRRKVGVGVIREELLVRVGTARYERALRHPHARVMDFTGRPMRGYVFVTPPGCLESSSVEGWVAQGLACVEQLLYRDDA